VEAIRELRELPHGHSALRKRPAVDELLDIEDGSGEPPSPGRRDRLNSRSARFGRPDQVGAYQLAPASRPPRRPRYWSPAAQQRTAASAASAGRAGFASAGSASRRWLHGRPGSGPMAYPRRRNHREGQAFLAPQPLNSLPIHHPSLTTQERMGHSIPEPWPVPRDLAEPDSQLLFRRQQRPRWPALRGSHLADRPTRPALRDSVSLAYMANGVPSAGRA
jgi:hypothetical protein